MKENLTHAANITVDDHEIAHFSAMADEWWDEKGKFRPLHQMNPVRLSYIRKHVISYFGGDADSIRPLAGLSLLDIGCGGGLVCEPMARMGADVTGIDAAEKNIRVASLHAEHSGIAVNYRCQTAETLAEQGQQFDIVLALEIIEHVANIDAFLKAAANLVKPGGLLFVSTLNRTWQSYAKAILGAEYILRWLPRGTHHWNKFLKPSEIILPLEHIGMQTLDLKGMIYNLLPGTWELSQNDLSVNYIITARK